jgi:hypothetical protein
MKMEVGGGAYTNRIRMYHGFVCASICIMTGSAAKNQPLQISGVQAVYLVIQACTNTCLIRQILGKSELLH